MSSPTSSLRRRRICFAEMRRLRRSGGGAPLRRGRGQGADAQNRSRCADHAVEPHRGDLLAVPVDVGRDRLRQLPLVALGQGIALDETLRQADHADLEASRELDGGGGAEGDLDAAASDVDHHRAAAADVHAVHRCLVDETRFLRPGDDPGLDAGLVFDAAEELAAVPRFADGAGRRG